MTSQRHDDKRSLYLAAGLGLAVAGIGFGLLQRSRRRNVSAPLSDAPRWTLHRSGSRALFGKSLLINRPRGELFAAWDVERFPEFMENVVAVEALADGVSRWRVKAPAGRELTLVNRITRVIPDEAISWQSEPQSDIANSGEVRFCDAPGGRGTYVSLVLAYSPPGGALGQAGAKLLQREPEVQARRDLHRFKQLMETGEVTTNAGPSARAAEHPAQSHI